MPIFDMKESLRNARSWICKVMNPEKEDLVEDSTLTPDIFWSEIEKAGDEYEKREAVVNSFVMRYLKKFLKLHRDEVIEDDVDFIALGMDSITFIQLWTRIQETLGDQLSLRASELMYCRNVGMLVRQIAGNISGVKFDKALALRAQIDLAYEDCALWSHIQAVGQPCPLSQIRTVFMTGVTGNFAPYMLEVISQRPGIQKIYCLVREGKNTTAEKRLKKHLKELKLKGRVDMTKVEVIPGDVTLEYFGMTPERYAELAMEVDAVFHNAVNANHIAKYIKEDIKYCGIRAVNVIGTQRILEFGAASKTKWMYLASSLFGVWTFFDTPEEFQPVQALDTAPDLGYGISKFVADQLAKQASQERGIPLKVFNFPKVSGESQTGRMIVYKNHFPMKFLHYAITGTIPDLPIPLQVVPVDLLAQITLRIFFDERADSGMYWVLNPHLRMEKEIAILIEEMGFEVKIAEIVTTRLETEGEVGLEKAWLDLAKCNANILKIIDEYKKREGFWRHNALGLLKNRKVRKFLKKEYGYKARFVNHEEFVEGIASSPFLRQWKDFYEDVVTSLTKLMNEYQFKEYMEDPENTIKQKFRPFIKKVETLIPDIGEIIVDPLDILRDDFRFAIDNAVDIFSKFVKLNIDKVVD